jgi:putative flippase GtrA
MISRQFGLFVLASGVAAAVNIGARYFLNFFLSYNASILIAFAFGLATAFVLNRKLVFAASGVGGLRQAARFTLVNLVAAAQVWGVSVFLNSVVFPAMAFTWQAATLAHICGVASPVATSYFAHKHFSFAQAREI